MQPNTDPAYLASQGLSATTYKRFISKVSVDDSTGCWIWTASISSGGYGQMSRNKLGQNPISAPRVSHILYHGPIPEGMEILHKCPKGHNRSCVNPEHLKAGTKAENMKDMANSGTCHFANLPHPTGSDSPWSKLTHEQREEIRARYTGKRGQQASLAREFRVSEGTIKNVVTHFVNRRPWSARKQTKWKA